MTENGHAAQNRSPGELVSDASSQISVLIRDELRLAQLELAQKGKRAGIGAGLFGASGITAIFGVGALVAAAILGLANVLSAWLAALIVGAALLVVAGIVALQARREVSHAIPPKPIEATEGIRSDVETIKEGIHR